MYQGNNYWCTMKNLYKFFLALGVYTSAFSQITEITRLPVQDFSQSIKKAPNYSLNKLNASLQVSGLASGVYIYQLRVNEFITSKKIELIR
jgi:hypothetical protein